MGLTIVLVENENETRIVEGEHWNYEDDMTAEDVAKKIAEAIDATDAWAAEGSTDDEPTMVTITPALEANYGTACNDGKCTVQIAAASEPEEEGAPLDVTGAVRIRSRSDGKPADFRGGEDETFVKIWQEDGVLLDGDFSTDNRMIIAGFIKGELVGKTHSGPRHRRDPERRGQRVVLAASALCAPALVLGRAASGESGRGGHPGSARQTAWCGRAGEERRGLQRALAGPACGAVGDACSPPQRAASPGLRAPGLRAPGCGPWASSPGLRAPGRPNTGR